MIFVTCSSDLEILGEVEGSTVVLIEDSEEALSYQLVLGGHATCKRPFPKQLRGNQNTKLSNQNFLCKSINMQKIIFSNIYNVYYTLPIIIKIKQCCFKTWHSFIPKNRTMQNCIKLYLICSAFFHKIKLENFTCRNSKIGLFFSIWH